ncbi:MULTISPECIES: hypothetical protein [Pseudomonas]|uniref:hypothetical protein n=1 Tax=Pseudomonas TaxID=286 RepID=UPI002234D5D7|nr:MULTISPECIES: hypothetical protein [Pseudomonas]MDP9514029.1 hypothetical protein [Pseudomonas protegens]UZE37627.1 hypothetical protein LOY69_14375 [Pseudomonas sp. B21-059]
MSDRFLAFRCFGIFAWPPLKSVEPDEPAAEGVVEIHYVLDAKKAVMVGCARWVPRDTWKPDLEFTTSLADIPPLPKTSDAAKTALKNAADRTLAWRFDQSGVVLAFEGVQVFEQYAVRKDQAGVFQQELDLRVPVVREHFPSVSASHYKSRVLIGQDNNPLLRFDLALPLLSPQDDEQFKAGRAFCRVFRVASLQAGRVRFHADCATLARGEHGVRSAGSLHRKRWGAGRFIQLVATTFDEGYWPIRLRLGHLAKNQKRRVLGRNPPGPASREIEDQRGRCVGIEEHVRRKVGYVRRGSHYR